MEILKRIINLIYALLMMVFVLIVFFDSNSFYTIIDEAIKLLGGTSLIFAVINFALFKKFTIWNK